MTFKKDGTIAYAEDFEDVTITFTPLEWQELVCFYEYRKHKNTDLVRPGKKYPEVFSKLNKDIYEKLISNPPKLKEGL